MAKGRRGNNEGSVTKRKDGTWQASCIVGYDEAGEPHKKYFYGKSQGEVLEKMKAVNDVVKETGSYEEDKKLTVAGWLERWLTEYKTNSIKTTTYESYLMNIKKHINPVIGGIKLMKLTTSDIQKLYNLKQSKGGRADGDGALSLRSVKYIHTILKQGLDKARSLKLIAHNPCDETELKKEGAPREIKHLDNDGLAALLERVKDSKHYTAYLLAISSGLRRGELLGLRWQDVDLKEDSVTVVQTLTTTKTNKLSFQTPKTKHSHRTIEIPAGVVAELKKHKKTQNEYRLQLGEAYDQKKYNLVFCKEDGSPYCPRTFARNFTNYAASAGLEGITLHSLRHSYATFCLEDGIDPRTTQENLGHHDVAFTLKQYSNATKKTKKEAVNAMGNRLKLASNEE